MLTEDDARVLLERAAATIEVRDSQPIVAERPAPRRWIVPVVAAAAVAASVVAGFALIGRDHSGEPSPAPRITDRIPSVFAYDADAAARMLGDLGLQVTRRFEEGCSEAPGRAVRTEPAGGSRFGAGEPVTLVVTRLGPLDDCKTTTFDRMRAWSILDYANGRGPVPPIAQQLSVTVNGKASDIDSALVALAAVTKRPEAGAFLDVRQNHPVKDCEPSSGRRGAADPSSPSFSMSIVFPSNGPFDPVCNVTNVYLASDDSIERLEVIVPSFVTDPPGPTPSPDPDGVGARFLAFAQGETDSVPVDTPVKLFLGNVYQRTISATQAEDRASYDLCAPYAGRSCPMSAVAELDGEPYRPVITDEVGSCVKQDGPELKPTGTGGSKHVRWGVAEPQTCAGDWVVELWYNDVGQITAVNLLLGGP